jgi:hypothetical protein
MVDGPAPHGTGELVWSSGTEAKGEFVCLRCGYGIVVSRVLPSCPMRGGASWQLGRSRLSDARPAR